jgi:hypothetical protein
MVRLRGAVRRGRRRERWMAVLQKRRMAAVLGVMAPVVRCWLRRLSLVLSRNGWFPTGFLCCWMRMMMRMMMRMTRRRTRKSL